MDFLRIYKKTKLEIREFKELKKRESEISNRIEFFEKNFPYKVEPERDNYSIYFDRYLELRKESEKIRERKAEIERKNAENLMGGLTFSIAKFFIR